MGSGHLAEALNPCHLYSHRNRMTAALSERLFFHCRCLESKQHFENNGLQWAAGGKALSADHLDC